LATPSAASSSAPACWTVRCGAEVERARRSSVERSSSVGERAAAGAGSVTCCRPSCPTYFNAGWLARPLLLGAYDLLDLSRQTSSMVRPMPIVMPAPRSSQLGTPRSLEGASSAVFPFSARDAV